jgi:hypothetical protein
MMATGRAPPTQALVGQNLTMTDSNILRVIGRGIVAGWNMITAGTMRMTGTKIATAAMTIAMIIMMIITTIITKRA